MHSDRAVSRVPKVASFSAARGRWFSADEWWRLAGIYTVVLVLHLLGWGLALSEARAHSYLLALGITAYLLGLRHAFDADHIAAIDDTVRFQLQRGKTPLGIGLFFSLGHSSVVLALGVGLALASTTIRQTLPALQRYGDTIGATLSGSFLLVVGVLNLAVLLHILRVYGRSRSGDEHTHVDLLLAQRGLLTRFFTRWTRRFIDRSWHMFPVGVLFGLGFDTASEVGLLAMTASAAFGALPLAGVLCLPLLFAAGMVVMDATDGVLMFKAYHWALVNPARKLLYNLTTTTLGAVVALALGSIELLVVLAHWLHLRGAFFAHLATLDFSGLGYVLVALLLLAWGISFGLWKWRLRFVGPALEPTLHTHVHEHEPNILHVHRHYHR